MGAPIQSLGDWAISAPLMTKGGRPQSIWSSLKKTPHPEKKSKSRHLRRKRNKCDQPLRSSKKVVKLPYIYFGKFIRGRTKTLDPYKRIPSGR